MFVHPVGSYGQLLQFTSQPQILRTGEFRVQSTWWPGLGVFLLVGDEPPPDPPRHDRENLYNISASIGAGRLQRRGKLMIPTVHTNRVPFVM